MAFKRVNRRQETCTTVGTGNVTLLGADATYSSFATAGLAVNDTFKYAIFHNTADPAQWEVGVGLWLGSSQFARIAVVDSTNSGALVSFTTGVKTVIATVDASELNNFINALATTGSSNAAFISGGQLTIPTYVRNPGTGGNNTAVGGSALPNNTTGAGNTAVGASSLSANIVGGSNTATGSSALSANTGDNNTATGNAALAANTSGGNNTADGVSALLLNTTGSGNSGVGANALASNTTASNVTAVGRWAGDNQSNRIVLSDGAGVVGLYAKTPSGGDSSSYVLLNGLTSQLSGGSIETPGSIVFQPPTAPPTLGRNLDAAIWLSSGAPKLSYRDSTGVTLVISLGGSAVTLTTTGVTGPATLTGQALNVPQYTRNTAADSNHLSGIASAINTTGTYNTTFGSYSGQGLSLGSYNTFVGNGAGEQTSSPSFNTAVGALAFALNTTGEKNLALGYRALYNNTTARAVVGIGGWNGDGQSNRIVLSDGDGQVGVYTKTPISGGDQSAYTLLGGRTSQSSGGMLEVPGGFVFQPPTALPTLGTNLDATIYMAGAVPTLLRRDASGVTTSYPLGAATGSFVQSEYAAYPDGLHIGNIGSTTTLGANNEDVLVLGDSSTNEVTTGTNLTVLNVQGGAGFAIDGNNIARMWTYVSGQGIKWATSVGSFNPWTAGDPSTQEYFSLRQCGGRTASCYYAGTSWTFTVFDIGSGGTFTRTTPQGSLFRRNGQPVDGGNPVEFAVSPNGSYAVILINPQGITNVMGEIALYTVVYNGDTAAMTWTQVGTNFQVPSAIQLSADDISVGNDGTPYYLNNTGDLFKLTGQTATKLVAKLIGGGGGSSTLASTVQGGTFRLGAYGQGQGGGGGLAAIYVPSTGATTQFAPATAGSVNWGCSFGPDGNLYALGLPNNSAGTLANVIQFSIATEANFVKPVKLSGGFISSSGAQPASNSVLITGAANAAVGAAAPPATVGGVLVTDVASGTRFAASSVQGSVLISNGVTAPSFSAAPPAVGAVLLGNPSGAASWAAPGTAGQVLASNGVGSAPSFKSAIARSIVRVTETTSASGAATFTNGTRGGAVTVVRNDCGITAPTNTAQAAWTLPAGNFLVTIHANYTSTASGPETIITYFGPDNQTPGQGALNAIHGTTSKSQTGADDIGATFQGYVSLSTSTTYFLSRFAGTTGNSSAAQITSTGSFVVIVEAVT